MANSSKEKVRRGDRECYRSLLVILCGLGVFACFCGFAEAHPSQGGTQRKVRKAPLAPPVEPVVVETPPPPPPHLTPGEMPPNPPSVSYEDGLLTIHAENSTLWDILNAVGSTTGATMDIPPNAGVERVWVQLGPGPARAIVAALLGGTDLDYAIQASDTDPNLMQSVLLTPRSKGGRVGDSTSVSRSFASRLSNRFRARASSGILDSSDSDSATTPDSATVSSDGDTSAPAAGNSQPTGTPSAQADSPADLSSTPTSTDTPSTSLSARLPLVITAADAHPAPVADPSQAIPQMQNLFELRRQLQEQQNAQQKVGTTQ